MSEYQYVGFRAIDGPVSPKNLEFMRRQSSRAEITPRSFDNEYHYGDFHGNAAEMLRRGYDMHLHYANYGIRTLMIRLPNGLPDATAARPYFMDDGFSFRKDKQGDGGILCIDPYFEAGELDELWDIEEIFERLLPLRAEILDGDLRPLYLAHLAVASDMNHDPEEEKDAPVPAGLKKPSDAQQAMAEFYGLSKAVIVAAAQDSPPTPKQGDILGRYEAWLQRQPETIKTTWLARLIADPQAAVRSDILAEFRKNDEVSVWPTVAVDRTIAELHASAEGVQQRLDQEAAEQAARKRAKKLADMVADPTKTLRATEKLVKERSLNAYEQIATLLADLRSALAGTPEAEAPAQQAWKLKEQNPTLKLLTSALRRKGFVKK